MSEFENDELSFYILWVGMTPKISAINLSNDTFKLFEILWIYSYLRTNKCSEYIRPNVNFISVSSTDTPPTGGLISHELYWHILRQTGNSFMTNLNDLFENHCLQITYFNWMVQIKLSWFSEHRWIEIPVPRIWITWIFLFVLHDIEANQVAIKKIRDEIKINVVREGLWCLWKTIEYLLLLNAYIFTHI